MLFNIRTYEKELLDSLDLPIAELHQNLKELDLINEYLGGYRASIKALNKLLAHRNIRTVTDIGCGAGDFIKALNLSSDKKLYFYGVDIKEDCINYAEENLEYMSNRKLICSDYKKTFNSVFRDSDVIHCSLFTHHLTDEEIIELFTKAKENNCILLINDLHRHWFAYYSIKYLTRLFSGSRLVRNDAPLSVRRGFKRNELINYAKQAGYKNIFVKWNWAFRFILTATP